MPTCPDCHRTLKMRGTLAKHQRLYHEGRRVMDSDLPPAKFTLNFFVNKVRQTLSCPVCTYKRDRCRDVRAIGNHFLKNHPAFKFVISYHCQWCNAYIDPAEIEVHAHAHAQNRAFGKPFSPPHPRINPEDGSLSFVHAPGADRCEYAHLKRVDPSGKILAVMFNRWHREKDVPVAWKQATTVLIYKKGDDADVSNFRPISLMSVIYKLFMGVMAKRLTKWSIDAGVLSDEQKSARPSEGCYEHTYLLKSLVADARRRKQKLFLAWLDIHNAFGSVPHATIRSVLRHIGVPPDLVTLVLNACTGATSVVRTPQGDTPAIPLCAGVKQGCPLSPILFNLCIELILRMVKAKASKLKSGACVTMAPPSPAWHMRTIWLSSLVVLLLYRNYSARLLTVRPSLVCPFDRTSVPRYRWLRTVEQQFARWQQILPFRVSIFQHWRMRSRIGTSGCRLV